MRTRRERPPVVLDASALLALLHQERGAHEVEAVVEGSALSAVNWSEVLHRARLARVDIAGMRSDVVALGVEIVPFDVDDAERTAAFSEVGQRAGLSLGDRACLALAQQLGRDAMTADRAWADLALEVGVRCIR